KTLPAAAMALARLDVPGLVLYNGSIAPGRFRGRDVTIQDVFEAVGAAAAGTMSNAEVHELENVACPGAGACGGQFTANTMAAVLEVLGISPAGLNDVPATDPAKRDSAYETGQIAMRLVRDDLRPSLPRPGGERGRRDARPAARRPDRAAAQADGRARDPARQPLAGRQRRQARRARAALPLRAGARLRLRGRVLRGGEGTEHQGR